MGILTGVPDRGIACVIATTLNAPPSLTKLLTSSSHSASSRPHCIPPIRSDPLGRLGATASEGFQAGSA